MKIKLWIAGVLLLCGLQSNAWAEERYAFDIKGQHAFVEFKVQHLGYSWLLGRFNTFEGSFTVDDAHPEKNRVNMILDVSSIDTNHAERDKHLRSDDFFDVAKFPTATFVSQSYRDLGDGKGELIGTFTLRGIRKSIKLDVTQTGKGADPWGGYRRGFEARTTLHLSDYNMAKAGMLGAAAENVELYLSIEGVRQ